MLLCLFLGGLIYPKLAIAESIAYMVCRLMYAVGYNSNKGATGRKFGAVLGFGVQFALFVTAGAAAYDLYRLE